MTAVVAAAEQTIVWHPCLRVSEDRSGVLEGDGESGLGAPRS